MDLWHMNGGIEPAPADRRHPSRILLVIIGIAIGLIGWGIGFDAGREAAHGKHRYEHQHRP